MVVIGLDPGNVTGLASWDASAAKLLEVLSFPEPFNAQRWVLNQCRTFEAMSVSTLVLLEDARKSHTGHHGKHFGNTKVLQGVGAVKRESKVWDQWLTHHGIAFIAMAPRGSLTKWKAPYFRAVTGWTGITNGHARDAACMVYGLNPAQASAMLREALARQATPAPKRKR